MVNQKEFWKAFFFFCLKEWALWLEEGEKKARLIIVKGRLIVFKIFNNNLFILIGG